MIQAGGCFQTLTLSVMFWLTQIGILAAQEKAIDARIEIEVLSDSRTNIRSKFWIDDIEIGDSTRGLDDNAPFYSSFRGEGKQKNAVTAVDSDRLVGFIIFGDSQFNMELRNRRPTKISIDDGYHITLTDSNEYIPVITRGGRANGGPFKKELDAVEWRPVNPRYAIGKLVAETLLGEEKWKQYRLLDEDGRLVLSCITDGQFSKISRTTKNKAIEFEFIDADSDSRLDFLRIGQPPKDPKDQPQIHFLVVQDSGQFTEMTSSMAAQFSKLGEDKFLTQWREKALKSSKSN